jgi:predicted nucleic acid-binding protein
MILVDTSIWIGYFRTGNDRLVNLLVQHQVYTHAFVIGELALGQFKNRSQILEDLRALPSCVPASHDEVCELVETWQLFGLGIGFVDAHLLASALLTQNTRLWTADKRLAKVADKMGLT